MSRAAGVERSTRTGGGACKEWRTREGRREWPRKGIRAENSTGSAARNRQLAICSSRLTSAPFFAVYTTECERVLMISVAPSTSISMSSTIMTRFLRAGVFIAREPVSFFAVLKIISAVQRVPRPSCDSILSEPPAASRDRETMVRPRPRPPDLRSSALT